jgi:hypothetical protein
MSSSSLGRFVSRVRIVPISRYFIGNKYEISIALTIWMAIKTCIGLLKLIDCH